MENDVRFNYWQLIEEIGTSNHKWSESLAIKAKIFDDLIDNLGGTTDLLFLNFNPVIAELSKKYSITVVCDPKLVELFNCDNCTVVSSVDSLKDKWRIVLALDEYFTYGENEFQQRKLMDNAAKVTKGWLITTLQDYKNFAPHKKNQIEAININAQHNYIVLENSIADKIDKQVWNHYWYCIKDSVNLLTIGPVKRHTMYFKQLAKYSSDAGAKQYVVQKNILYKGFFSKSFEHVITVNF